MSMAVSTLVAAAALKTTKKAKRLADDAGTAAVGVVVAAAVGAVVVAAARRPGRADSKAAVAGMGLERVTIAAAPRTRHRLVARVKPSRASRRSQSSQNERSQPSRRQRRIRHRHQRTANPCRSMREDESDGKEKWRQTQVGCADQEAVQERIVAVQKRRRQTYPF